MEKTNITNEGTKVSNHFSNGWYADTTINVNGQQWEITTMKRYSGNLGSKANRVKKSNDGNGFTVTQYDSESMFNSITLASEKVARVTEKAVREQHAKALVIFEEKIENGEISTEAPIVPEIGTILFLEGYNMNQYSKGNMHIVYAIDGSDYHCVEFDTLEISVKDHVRPISKKFGIGMYFDPSYKYEGSEDELANLVLIAREKSELDDKTRREREEYEKGQWLQKIELGKDNVTVPNWAQSVIVAELYENESDSQTDYFSARVARTVYLAFSANKRNNLAELQRAAKIFDETAELSTQEEAEKSCLHYQPDYFLGSTSFGGWKVSKHKYFDFTKETDLNQLYVAEAEGRFLIEEAKAPEEPDAPDAVKIENLNITLVNYSEKAVALFGDTKEIKEELKKIGGKFNRALTFEGGKQAGWIFQKSKREKVEALLAV